MKKVFIVLTLAIIFSFKGYGSSLMPEVTKEIERVNSMREALVSGVQGEVSPEVFKAVCMPVGRELKRLSKQLNIEIKQTSIKYRNPSHKPNEIEGKILQNMNDDKSLLSLWQSSDNGLHYFRRISVQKACLNCHGSKSSRPDFIKKKYSNDKAFGFKVGDLRGAYSVFIPDKKSSKK